MDDAELIKERREEWARRLDSGDYAQGYGQLAKMHLEDGKITYCCLGVACEMAHEAGIVGRISHGAGTIYFYGVDDPTEEHDLILPEAVATWFGFNGRSDCDPQAPDGVRFSSHNDEKGATFPEIAQMIRDLP
jgi:hypothetical protein